MLLGSRFSSGQVSKCPWAANMSTPSFVFIFLPFGAVGNIFTSEESKLIWQTMNGFVTVYLCHVSSMPTTCFLHNKLQTMSHNAPMYVWLAPCWRASSDKDATGES